MPKTASGQLAQSDPDLISRTDSALINIMVKMDVDPVASYRGGVADLQATSPSTTGKTLKANEGAVNAYNGYLITKTTAIHRAVTSKVPSVKIGRDFLVAFGGFSATVPANQAKLLLNVPGVAAVMYDKDQHPTDMVSPDFVGASAVWPSLGGDVHAGEGTVIGVLDTGIWPEHPMLEDKGIPNPGKGTLACQFGDGTDPDLGAAFTCNDKLIGAYAFVDTNLAVNGGAPEGFFCNAAGTECSARDAEGHGTHTSTTAAGDKVSSSVLLGVDRGPVSGMAPGASVIMYRVCIDNSCYQSDSIAATEQAIEDDVDAINFSIGGGPAYSDPVELAFLDAYASGIAVNASAGNSGPGAATTEHGGPWVTTLGASTLPRSFESTLHLTANGGAHLDIKGATITAGVTSPTPVILGSKAPYSDALCEAPPTSASLFAGKIVVCERGINARVDKGHNAFLGGAAGFILYNQAATVTDVETDNHWLPAIQVQFQNDAVKKFVKNHSNVKAWWDGGAATASQADVMASFSSRGPLGDFIKPDVTAPGVQVLAGMTPQPASTDEGPPGQLFQAIAGTSMSSPHAAGVSLLIKAAHPSWTPGQIKSALMTSSIQAVVKEDGHTPADPFDRGAGSIRADRAVNPTVTFDVSAPDYYASANDPFARINLNLPSINAPHMPGEITVTRTIQDVTGVAQTLKAITKAPNNSAIIVNPSTINVPAFGTATFQVTIDGAKLADGQYFGSVTLDPTKAGYNNVFMPVAFFHEPADVSLDNSCGGTGVVADKATMHVGETKDCRVTVTNNKADEAHVSVKVAAPNNGKLVVQNYSDGDQNGNGFLWNGTLSPQLPPEVEGLAEGDTLFGGFFDLDGLVAGDTSFTDESFANLGLPSEVGFGDERYDTVGIVSDGYLVLGGASASDVNCCNIPDMPDPTEPNGVLAPFWTDLNPEDGGEFFAASFDDSDPNAPANCYYLFEWKAYPVFSTGHDGSAGVETFEIWMLSADCAEYFDAVHNSIAFDYGPIATPGGGTPFNVGVENRLGTSGADIGPNVMPNPDGYVVVVTDSTPGGSETITYQVHANAKGTFIVDASMTSDVTQGTAHSLVKVKVKP